MGEHWYGRDGSSQYDADLRKARKQGYVPSVTTVLSVIDKAALTTWLIDQHIMAALTMPRIDGESEPEFIKRIKVDGRAQAKAAAEEGTRIHNVIEESFQRGFTGEELHGSNDGLHIVAVGDELHRMFPDVHDWVSEKSFAHCSGFGGKVDLHSPSTGIIVDFKTKDGPLDDGKRVAYDQNIQLAAYQVGLCLTGGRNELAFTQCANIFVSRTHAGRAISHLWSADEVAYGWEVFERALALWKSLKKYDGAF